MPIATVRKAVATLYTTLPAALATLVGLGVLDGAAQDWVLGLAGVLVAPLTYIGVYRARANTRG